MPARPWRGASSMSGRPAARAAARSAATSGVSKTDVVQAFAALLEELGDAAVRIDRLEELDLAAADRQKRGLHALVLHRRLGRDARGRSDPARGRGRPRAAARPDPRDARA